MAITIYPQEAFAKMRVAGRLAADVLDMITPYVVAGVSTESLDTRMQRYIEETQNAVSACLGYGYPPFPKATCISVNHVICHGIPSQKTLKNGDIVNIDVTVIKEGYHGDTSRMFIVGKPSVLAQRLVDTTYECLYRGIEVVKPGATFGDIGHAIQTHAHAQRFSVVRDFCGHGIGKNFHEEPQVMHYGQPNTGATLKEGMIFTIEPMINAGGHQMKILKDGWTAVTRDRSLSAQWEHTLGVTKDGYEIFTYSAKEREHFNLN